MAGRTWTGFLELRGKQTGVKGSFASAEKSLAGIQSRLKSLGMTAAFAAAGIAVVSTAKKIAEFEKSISALSAITGATGADLDKLTEASKRIGQTTTLSASQAAEAFKLMASAKPDLLANLDALEATTEAAVTLAEAAGLELPAATTALGEALNQFGAGADQATRFIDVLAEGARLGSSEIGQTSEALKNAGTVAKLAGLSFEETNAAIQGLAKSGIKGSDAGTKLRAVLIKLQNQADDNLNPAVVGINKALENLAEANLSTSEKVALFGERSIATADVLVANRKTVLDLSGALEDSLGAANDQARTRTDNLAGDMKRLQSVFEAVQINLGNKMLPVLRAFAQSLTDILTVVNDMTGSDGINKANTDFSAFDATLKGLFVTGSIVKNILESLAAGLVFVGRSIVDALSGNFDLIDDHFAELQVKIQQNGSDIAEAAFRSFEPEAAKAIDDANASLAPAVESLLEEVIVEPMRRAVVTAGDEAAAAAEAKAQELAAKEATKEAERLERIRQGFRTEAEVVAEAWELKNEQLRELLDNELITREEYKQKQLDMAREFALKEAALESSEALKREKFIQMTEKQKTNFVLGEAIRLTQGTAQHSKTMFKINKAAAIANAVVNTAQGVTKTLSEYPYPVNIAFAALTAAAGIAQISAIKSQSFNGGGGGTTPSAAGSAPVINDNPVGAGGPLDVPGVPGGGTPSQTIRINVDGLPDAGPVPAEMVRELINGINEQLGDGANLNPSPGG